MSLRVRLDKLYLRSANVLADSDIGCLAMRANHLPTVPLHVVKIEISFWDTHQSLELVKWVQEMVRIGVEESFEQQ
ncbi:MAG: hypothetical protein NPIRA05_16080 [Nitrospirales bacterium]|nr:MAG: hypothetical protein NPIRA05_16080 [Nitrospirales bacterium]